MDRKINHPACNRRIPGFGRIRRTVLLALVLGPLGPADASPVGPVYRISPSEDLSRVEVQVRLPPEHRGELGASRGRLSAISSLVGCDEQPVDTRRNRILADTADGCLSYSYPLTALGGRRSPEVDRGVILTTPNEWLWTPEPLSPVPIRIEVSLPQAMGISVPWREIGPGVFELPASPGSASATAVFGAFSTLEIPVGAARLRVAAVDGPDLSLDPERLSRWLETAAADVAGVAGSFPSPDVQVIVQPARSRGRSPVPFGYVIRDGGEAVRFFVDPTRSLADLYADWTATHEFSHLLLPYVGSREKWVSEGFASYYQNVLMARRGAYTEHEAWSRLHRSFVRAREVGDPPPPDELHERNFWEVRMLVYWNGAALALQADAALRSAAEGESLDTVLGRLAACCLPSQRVWTAAELFTRLDELAGADVFMPLYESRMREPGMPDLTDLYAELGIEPTSDTAVRLTDAGRRSAVREAIMAPKP